MNVLLGILIGVSLGIAAIQLGAQLVGPLAKNALIVVSVLLGLAGALSGVIYLFRSAILARVRLKADAAASDLKLPAVGLATAIASRDVSKSVSYATELGTVLFAWQAQVRSRQAIIALLTALLAMFAAILGSSLLVAQNELLAKQNELVVIQNQLVESQRRAGLVFELSNVLDQISAERRAFHEYLQAKGVKLDDPFLAKRKPQLGSSQPELPLSAGLRGRVIALSNAFRPYRYLDTEGVPRDRAFERLAAEHGRIASAVPIELHRNSLSPERGQLLTALLSSDVDVVDIVSSGADFRYADLSRVRLTCARLGPINLAGANLNGIVLDRAEAPVGDFSGADLRTSLLDYSDFRRASFRGADLRGASMRFAQLARVSFSGAVLPEAKNLAGAHLVGAYLEGALVPSERWLDELRDVADPGSRSERDQWTLAQHSNSHWAIVKVGTGATAPAIASESAPTVTTQPGARDTISSESRPTGFGTESCVRPVKKDKISK